jgi:hypothetical protein
MNIKDLWTNNQEILHDPDEYHKIKKIQSSKDNMQTRQDLRLRLILIRKRKQDLLQMIIHKETRYFGHKKNRVICLCKEVEYM